MPKGRTGGKRQQDAGMKVARLIHNVDHQILRLFIFTKTNMDMHTKNEKSFGHSLQIIQAVLDNVPRL